MRTLGAIVGLGAGCRRVAARRGGVRPKSVSVEGKRVGGRGVTALRTAAARRGVAGLILGRGCIRRGCALREVGRLAGVVADAETVPWAKKPSSRKPPSQREHIKDRNQGMNIEFPVFFAWVVGTA